MRGLLDFSSWSTTATTLLSLVLVSLVLVGIRLVFMQTFQRRRERENRQINERLKVLIAAYKTLGGSFTGVLTVDPAHLRDMQREAPVDDEGDADSMPSASERRRRIRDAVEAALSDVILLGTEEQVRLAAHAANEMVEGRNVEVAAVVVSLRDFIRQALDLTPVPADTKVPNQGPLRVNAGGGNTRRGGGVDGRSGRGSSGGGGGAAGLGIGMGTGAGGSAAVGGSSRTTDTS
jgi:heme exporter protein D